MAYIADSSYTTILHLVCFTISLSATFIRVGSFMVYIIIYRLMLNDFTDQVEYYIEQINLKYNNKLLTTLNRLEFNYATVKSILIVEQENIKQNEILNQILTFHNLYNEIMENIKYFNDTFDPNFYYFLTSAMLFASIYFYLGIVSFIDNLHWSFISILVVQGVMCLIYVGIVIKCCENLLIEVRTYFG